MIPFTPKTDVSNPASYEDLVELLVPELQRRGLMWDDYTVPGGTYRENLLNTPGHPGVPEGHPAYKFRYEILKRKYADENGDITIDRRTPPQVVDEKQEEEVAVTKEEKTLPIVEKAAAVVESVPAPAATATMNGEQPKAVEATA